jgi:hypothetical protein
MARPTLVWLCPYDGRELLGKAGPGWGMDFNTQGTAVGHNRNAVKTTEMR